MRILVDHGRSENFGDEAMVQGTLTCLTEKYPSHTFALSEDGLWESVVWSFPSLERIPTYHVVPGWPDPFLHAQPARNINVRGVASLWPSTRFPVLWPALNLVRAFQRYMYQKSWPQHPIDFQSQYITVGRKRMPLLEWCDQFDAGLIPGGLMTDEFTASLYRQCMLMHAFHALGKPFYVYGIQHGPFTKKALRRESVLALKTANVCTLRAGSIPEGVNAQCVDDMSVYVPVSTNTLSWLQQHGLIEGKYLVYHMRSSFYNPSMRRHIKSYAALLRKLSTELKMPLLHVPISVKTSDNDRRWGQKMAVLLKGTANYTIDDVSISDTSLIKGIVGKSYGVIGVSYHACQFALSQGVPAINIFASDHYNFKAQGLVGTYNDTRLALHIPSNTVDDAYTQCMEVFSDSVLRARLQKRSTKAIERLDVILSA
jgi:polysaccharide pyruvyl transferase WcaK-like protein